MGAASPDRTHDQLSAAVLAALEAAGVSAMLCRGEAQLLGMTSGAANLVATGHWLAVRHGRLACADSSIPDLIKPGCAEVSTGAGPAQIGFVLQPTAGGERPLTLRFNAFRVTGGGGGTQSLVLIVAGAGDTPDPAAWRATFGFTATEAAVAAMVFDGISVKQIAAMRRVSVETIRSHLKTIFQKAGVSRMGQLSAVLRQHG